MRGICAFSPLYQDGVPEFRPGSRFAVPIASMIVFGYRKGTLTFGFKLFVETQKGAVEGRVGGCRSGAWNVGSGCVS